MPGFRARVFYQSGKRQRQLALISTHIKLTRRPVTEILIKAILNQLIHFCLFQWTV